MKHEVSPEVYWRVREQVYGQVFRFLCREVSARSYRQLYREVDQEVSRHIVSVHWPTSRHLEQQMTGVHRR